MEWKMPPYVALRKAREIIKADPNKILCGSLAMYLYKVGNIRLVSDIDFCIEDINIQKNMYQHENIWFPHTHCLFKLNSVNYKIIKGIKVQNLQDILKWKASFNRPKDKSVINFIQHNEDNQGADVSEIIKFTVNKYGR